MPRSSSSSMKVIPLAVSGRWRATTMPATSTVAPSSIRLRSVLRATPLPKPFAQQRHRVLAEVDPGRAVVLDHLAPSAPTARARGAERRLERQRQLRRVPGALRGPGDAEAPVVLAAMLADSPRPGQAVERPGPGQPLQPVAAGPRAGGEIGDPRCRGRRARARRPAPPSPPRAPPSRSRARSARRGRRARARPGRGPCCALTSAARPAPPAAGPRGPGSRAGRSPSAARSAASRGTPAA